MFAWRSLASWVTLSIICAAAQGQTYTLQERDVEGSYFEVQIETNLKGKLHIQQEDKTETLEQRANARHHFLERVLKAGDDCLINKTARHYESASVAITVGKHQSDISLRKERALMVAQRTKNELLTYSPEGPLTREELDLMQHFDTLALPGLLPEKAVAVDDSWMLQNPSAQALCYLDGVTSHELMGKLKQVDDEQATISVSGPVSGIASGAVVKLQIKATCVFDLESKRITALEWTQQDDREQGPVSPALSAEVSVKVTRTPIEPVAELNDFALVPIPQTDLPPDSMTVLSYRDPKGRYLLSPAREWISVARTDNHLVLRLLDRGDFLAQATVTNWPKAEAGKHISAEEFKTAMAESPGWDQEEVLKGEEVTAENGYWIYQLAAAGKLNGLKTVQFFYLVAGPRGDQLVIAFTMTPAQAERLGTRDLDLVRSVVFPGSAKQATTDVPAE